MKVLALEGQKSLKSFIDFPHDLYRNDPNYVPELYIAQHDILTPGKHPFHEHSKVQLFLAYDDQNKVCGRIAAILNNNHNTFNNTTDGFFGFFECINNQEVATALLNEAEVWLKKQGITNIIGPANFSTNETVGLLVDGYDSPPVVMMPYNYSYYLQLIENAGYAKKTDLLAYDVPYDTHNDRSVRLLGALQARLKRSNIIIRKLNMKDFKNEAAKLRDVYNQAWDRNLGFVPMTEKEFDHMAKDLKLILNPEFCLVAEQGDKFIGFALGIPDINQVLRKVKRGRLLPFGIFKLLFGLKKVDWLRVMALGVLTEYRKLGIEACLYGIIIQNAMANNIKGAECSWMLEDNYMMNNAIEAINGKIYKKYRLLEKAL
ncbi:hypothetical protein [Arcticibacter eurypsychrophilus]|uniref:hypothetical protein n=1 Tax=Arcticibacter eurypsychrophilus TaxID=1434752 RepID=UPI00084CF43B|nr:hypothetical protein [Arcticibacter eurypsychrophilus]